MMEELVRECVEAYKRFDGDLTAVLSKIRQGLLKKGADPNLVVNISVLQPTWRSLGRSILLAAWSADADAVEFIRNEVLP